MSSPSRAPSHLIQAHQIALMSAVAETFSLTNPNLAYEPKYDGIRVKVFMGSGTSAGGVTIWSRTGSLTPCTCPISSKHQEPSGLHIFMPMVVQTSFRHSWEFCELVSQLVARKHDRQATVERSVTRRGKGVYLRLSAKPPRKVLAAPYSVRANRFAGVSTPLRWQRARSRSAARGLYNADDSDRLKSTGDLSARIGETRRIDLNRRTV